MKYIDRYNELLDLIAQSGKNFVTAYETSLIHSVKKEGNVFICGMGGSAISGDYIRILSELHGNNTSIVQVCREYILPKAIIQDSIAVVISYSGNTEETLMMLDQLLEMQNRPMILSSGGELMKIASNKQLQFVPIEPNYQPRMAFSFLFGSLYALLLGTLGLDSLDAVQKESIISTSESIPSQMSSLNEFATMMVNKLPIIISSNDLSPLATRLRCQLNENAKISAANFVVPEFNHNAIVGFDGSQIDNFVLVLLRSSNEYPRVKTQMEFIKKTMKARGVPIIEMASDASSRLEELLDLTWRIDCISVLLAKNLEVDPLIVPSINALKTMLNNE
ncbi:MAG: SIS domain-containing protein [Candidatus Kariarchaeaceae archaeon]